MYYYSYQGRLAASPLEGLPLPKAEAGVPDLFFTDGGALREGAGYLLSA